MELTEGTASPPQYRLWSAIACVAGALERRVWLHSRQGLVYPNLYVMLVGAPGVGKYVIELVKDLWTGAQLSDGSGAAAFNVASDSVTRASLVDELGGARKSFLPPNGGPYEYASLCVAAEEMGIFMPTYEMQFIATLNGIWNGKPEHKETRRTSVVKDLTIPNPMITGLFGAQPGWLSSVFPEEAWSTGLTARMLMIYAADSILLDPFSEAEDTNAIRSGCLHQLSQLSRRWGEVPVEQEAKTALSAWFMSGGPPTPTHSKLANYNRRRGLQMLKLMLISSAAAGRPRVAREDFNRALSWLLSAEKLMPDIFREMTGKSDSLVLEELHHYAGMIYRANGGSPVHESKLFEFLRVRVPSEKITRLLEVAERSGLFNRVAGTADLYIPKPRELTAVE